MEVSIVSRANLMTHGNYINRLIHATKTSKTLDEIKSIRNVFGTYTTQLEKLRSDLEQNVLNNNEFFALYPHLDKYSHLTTKDFQREFEILQKIEKKAIYLRRTLKLSIAFNEIALAHERNCEKALDTLFKKYYESFNFLCHKWENKHQKRSTVLVKIGEQCHRRINNLIDFTIHSFHLISASNFNQIKNLPKRYRAIIAKELWEAEAILKYSLFKIKLYVNHRRSSKELNKNHKKRQLNRNKWKRSPKNQLKLTRNDSNGPSKEEKVRESSSYSKVTRVILNWKTRKKKK